MKKTPIKLPRIKADDRKKKDAGAQNPPGKISAKLAALKRALEDGSFSVDSEAVADQLIGDSRRTLRRPVKKH